MLLSRPARRAFADFGWAVALVCGANGAQAQMFKDATFETLHRAEKHVELQRLAKERLAAQPDDNQAVLALALSALTSEDGPRRQAAITQAEGCVQRQPQAALCHYALGVVLGVQAMSEGMMKAARSAGTIRTALTQAHTLEPTWYPARSALMEFHLMAPGFMGGSSAKAVELASGAANPEQVRALQARVGMGDKKYDSALQTFTSLLAVPDAALVDDVRGWATAAAYSLISAGEAPKAQPYFERLARERPAEAQGPYGLARVRMASGAPADAVKLYEQASKMNGADKLPIDYRMGLALLELNKTTEARAALGRFVAAGKGQKSSLDDAKKRLEQLGG
jgi:tetratricopeptide (TPR) repeat protein